MKKPNKSQEKFLSLYKNKVKRYFFISLKKYYHS